MTKIWKEIKYLGNKSNNSKKELHTDEGEIITSDNEILNYMINDMEKTFHINCDKIDNTFTNTIINTSNDNDIINNQIYKTSTYKRKNSPLWFYLNNINTKHKEHLSSDINKNEVYTAIKSQKKMTKL